ncbi:MAG: terminase family protein [Deltaproteobacteria bacterium]|nr:terminase family protein [Deltaproteobacteria bacterium]
MVDIIQVINDRHLFRPLFKNLATWWSWMVFLKALFALAMNQEEQALYTQCTGRQAPPERPFQEVWAPTGRRSGKSFVAALVAVFLACFTDYRKYLAPGERAYILIIAADRQQAGVILRYVKGFLASNKMLSKLVEAERAEAVDLTNRVTIQVATCSYRSIRGFTVVAAICDEIAFWRSEENSANPANEVLRAVRPSLATIPDSLLLCISSPWARTGPLWQAMNKHHGRDDSDVMVWNAATRVMNPTIKQRVIDRDMEEDPAMAANEWQAIFRSDLESFISLEALEAAMVQGRLELPPVHPIPYRAFVDPSGGRRDAATLAIAHLDKGRVVLDVARAWRAPHDPAQVVQEMAAVLKVYGVHQVVGDRYAGEWPRQEFMKHRITYQTADKDKSSLYLDFLPLVLSQRVELLDLKHLKNELVSLERRARSAGRDLVDHPPRGHDDLANAVAGVCSGLGTRPMMSSCSMEFLI